MRDSKCHKAITFFFDTKKKKIVFLILLGRSASGFTLSKEDYID